jgi:hypothetical protein
MAKVTFVGPLDRYLSDVGLSYATYVPVQSVRSGIEEAILKHLQLSPAGKNNQKYVFLYSKRRIFSQSAVLNFNCNGNRSPTFLSWRQMVSSCMLAYGNVKD